MNDESSPPAAAKTSTGVSCFIISIALIGVCIVLYSIVAPMLFEGWGFPDMGGESPAVGKLFSDLNLEPITFSEKPVTRQDLSGKVVLINFWATWCGPCRAELPELAEIGERYADDADFLLLPISCGGDVLLQLSTESILMLQDMHLEMPCYADPNDTARRSYAMAAGTNQMDLPTTLVLDRKGIIRGVWIGYRPSQGKRIRELIETLLAEKPKPLAEKPAAGS